MPVAGQFANAARCGARIRAARKRRRLTQEEVGALAGFTGPQVGYVEVGKINTPIETLARIAAALDLTLEDIFNDETPFARRA